MHVQSFDSLDDMFEAMRKGQKAANDNLNGAQRELRDDFENIRYWVKNTGHGFLEFGIAWSENENRDSVAATLPPGLVDFESEELDEVLYEIAAYPVNRMAGYLFGRAFSHFSTEGELGSTHAVTVMPITREAFEEARAAGWNMDADTTPTLIHECLEIEAYIRQARNGAAK